jgi:hypothetical protein
VCFISVSFLIFGIKYELSYNDELKEALFCQKHQLNYSNDTIPELFLFINDTKINDTKQSSYDYWQKENYKDCTPIMQKMAKKSENILNICILYIIVYIGLQMYFNKNFRDGVFEDLAHLNKFVEKFLKFEYFKRRK